MKLYGIMLSLSLSLSRASRQKKSRNFLLNSPSASWGRPHIAFVLLLLLYFIYFPLTCAFLCYVVDSPNEGVCAIKIKYIWCSTPERYQLNFQRLLAWIILLFIVFFSSPFNSSSWAFSRLLYLIEAHIFHLYSSENFSRYLHYPELFLRLLLVSRKKEQLLRNFRLGKQTALLLEMISFFGEKTNWKCVPFRTIMTWRITKISYFAIVIQFFCRSGFFPSFVVTSPQRASPIPILIKISIVPSVLLQYPA